MKENSMSLALEKVLNQNGIPYKKEYISEIESIAEELDASLTFNLQKIINLIGSFNIGKFQKSKKPIDELVKQCEISKNQLSLIDPLQIEMNMNLFQQNISSLETAKQTISNQYMEVKDLLSMQMSELMAYPMQMQEYINSTANSNYQLVINLSHHDNRQFLIGITYLMREQQISKSIQFPQTIQWCDVQTLFRKPRIKEAMRNYDILLLTEESAVMARQCFVNFEQDNLLSPFWEWFQICLQYYEQISQYAPLRDSVRDLSLQVSQIQNDIDGQMKQKGRYEQELKEYKTNLKQYEALKEEYVQHNFYCWQQYLQSELQNISVMQQHIPQILFNYATQKRFQHLNVKESTIIQQSLNKMIGTPRTYVTDYPFLQVKFYLLQQQQISFIYDEQNLIDLFIEYLEKKQKIVEKKSYSEALNQQNLDYLVVNLEKIEQIKHFKQLNTINQTIHYLVIIPSNQLTQYQQLYNNEFVNLNSDLDNFSEYQKLYFGQTCYQQYNLYTEEELIQFIDKLKQSSFGSSEEMYDDIMANPLFQYQQQNNFISDDYTCEMFSIFKKIESKFYNIEQQKYLYQILTSIKQDQLNLSTFIECSINSFLKYSSNRTSLSDVMNDSYILEIISQDMMEPPFLIQSDCVSYLKIYPTICQLCHAKSVNFINYSNFIKTETTKIMKELLQSQKIKQFLKDYQLENQDRSEEQLKKIQFEEQQCLQQLINELEIQNQKKQEQLDSLAYNTNLLGVLEKKDKDLKPQRNSVKLQNKLKASLCFLMANDKNMSLLLFQSLQMLFYLLNFNEVTCATIRQSLNKVDIIKKLNEIRIIDIDVVNIKKYKEQRERLKQEQTKNYLIMHLNDYFNEIDKHIQQSEEYIYNQMELKKIQEQINDQKQISFLFTILQLKEKIDIQQRIIVKNVYERKVQQLLDTHSSIQIIINQEIQRIELSLKFMESFQKEIILLLYLKSENYSINHQILFFILKQFHKNQSILYLIQTNKPILINKIIKKINFQLISNVKKNQNLKKLYIIGLIKEIIQKYIKH